jgi:hypothetical protein
MATIRAAVFVVAGCLLVSSAVTAQVAVNPPFDHYGTNENRTYSVKVRPGEFFEVTIDNTCAKQFFDIESFGVIAAVPAPAIPTARRGQTNDCVASAAGAPPRTIQVPHLPQYGGYVVSIKPADGLQFIKSNAASNCSQANPPADCKPAKEILLFVSVGRRGYDYDISGAFTISDLTDPVYSLQEESNGETPIVVVERDQAAEDDFRLGFAGFINLFHQKFPSFAGTFGLGISEGSEVNFFLGPSWRLGGKAYLTAGWNWGSVRRLPSGVSEGDVVSNANLLTELPTRTDSALFVAVSYIFLSPGEAFLKKPFATKNDTK